MSRFLEDFDYFSWQSDNLFLRGSTHDLVTDNMRICAYGLSPHFVVFVKCTAPILKMPTKPWFI